MLVGVLAVYARFGARFIKESAAGPVGTGMLLGMLGLAFVWLLQLPVDLLALWWQRRHDISRLGYDEWLLDNWLSLGGSFLFACVALAIAMGLARLLPRLWWAPASVAFTSLFVLFLFVSPYLTPTEPLRDPSLRAAASRLAAQVGKPGTPVEVEEVESFTTEPNAMAMGLWGSERVVLWDTLLSSLPRPQVRHVIAHELGHLQGNHLEKMVGWFALLAVPSALAVALIVRRRGGLGNPEAVPLALLAFVVIQLASTPAQSAFVRRLEAEADWIALETARDPATARASFISLTKSSLADPDPPGWAHTLFDTHPTTLERVAMVDAWEEHHPDR